MVGCRRWLASSRSSAWMGPYRSPGPGGALGGLRNWTGSAGPAGRALRAGSLRRWAHRRVSRSLSKIVVTVGSPSVSSPSALSLPSGDCASTSSGSSAGRGGTQDLPDPSRPRWPPSAHRRLAARLGCASDTALTTQGNPPAASPRAPVGRRRAGSEMPAGPAAAAHRRRWVALSTACPHRLDPVGDDPCRPSPPPPDQHQGVHGHDPSTKALRARSRQLASRSPGSTRTTRRRSSGRAPSRRPSNKVPAAGRRKSVAQ